MLHGLKQGNEVLKEIHKEMNIESVEKLMEETQEARAYQEVNFYIYLTPVLILTFAKQELSGILANSLSLDEEEAVQAELRELQEAVVCFETAKRISCLICLKQKAAEKPVELPSAPTESPVAVEGTVITYPTDSGDTFSSTLSPRACPRICSTESRGASLDYFLDFICHFHLESRKTMPFKLLTVAQRESSTIVSRTCITDKHRVCRYNCVTDATMYAKHSRKSSI